VTFDYKEGVLFAPGLLKKLSSPEYQGGRGCEEIVEEVFSLVKGAHMSASGV